MSTLKLAQAGFLNIFTEAVASVASMVATPLSYYSYAVLFFHNHISDPYSTCLNLKYLLSTKGDQHQRSAGNLCLQPQKVHYNTTLTCLHRGLHRLITINK